MRFWYMLAKSMGSSISGGKPPFRVASARICRANGKSMRGHSIIDPAEYVPRAQLAEWAERDPILRLRKVLESKKLWSDKEENELIESVNARVLAAIKQTETTPMPPVRQHPRGRRCA